MKTWQHDSSYETNFMVQIPAEIDPNVFYLFNFRQDFYSLRVTGLNHHKVHAFFQLTWHDKANGIIYYGKAADFYKQGNSQLSGNTKTQTSACASVSTGTWS